MPAQSHNVSVRQAEASWLTKEQVFDLAESIAKQLQFKFGDDISELVKRMGGRISVEDTLTTDPERSGSLFVDGVGKFTVVVPSHTSALRDNYTLAHELGHYAVHYLWYSKSRGLSGGKMIAMRKGSNRVEWEANWFAAAFLMPKKQFTSKWNEYGGAADKIALLFCVSRQAAEIRAKQLSLV